MSFYEKYLKYKTKYLNLVNQIGGDKKSAYKYFLDFFTIVPVDMRPELYEYLEMTERYETYIKEEEMILKKKHPLSEESKRAISVIEKKQREYRKHMISINTEIKARRTEELNREYDDIRKREAELRRRVNGVSGKEELDSGMKDIDKLKSENRKALGKLDIPWNTPEYERMNQEILKIKNKKQEPSGDDKHTIIKINKFKEAYSRRITELSETDKSNIKKTILNNKKLSLFKTFNQNIKRDIEFRYLGNLKHPDRKFKHLLGKTDETKEAFLENPSKEYEEYADFYDIITSTNDFVLNTTFLLYLFNYIYSELLILFDNNNVKLNRHVEDIIKLYINNEFGVPCSFSYIDTYLKTKDGYAEKETARQFMIDYLLLEPIIIEKDLYKFVNMTEMEYVTIVTDKSQKLLNKSQIQEINIVRNNNKKSALFAIFKNNINNDIDRGNLNVANMQIHKICKKDAEDMKTLSFIFDDIYIKLLSAYKNDDNELNKYIDFIIRSYLYNNFGSPSSIENITRFIAAVEQYDLLLGYGHKIKTLSEIKSTGGGLNELEEYLSHPTIEAELIKIYREKGVDLTNIQEPIEPILDTPYVTVYKPLTTQQSIEYGRFTNWCTTSNNDNNMFDKYTKEGPLYIIIKKRNPNMKFQLHVFRNELCDRYNKSFSITEMLFQLLNQKLPVPLPEPLLVSLPNKYIVDFTEMFTDDSDKVVADGAAAERAAEDMDDSDLYDLKLKKKSKKERKAPNKPVVAINRFKPLHEFNWHDSEFIDWLIHVILYENITREPHTLFLLDSASSLIEYVLKTYQNIDRHIEQILNQIKDNIQITHIHLDLKKINNKLNISFDSNNLFSSPLMRPMLVNLKKLTLRLYTYMKLENIFRDIQQLEELVLISDATYLSISDIETIYLIFDRLRNLNTLNLKSFNILIDNIIDNNYIYILPQIRNLNTLYLPTNFNIDDRDIEFIHLLRQFTSLTILYSNKYNESLLNTHIKRTFPDLTINIYDTETCK